MPTDLNTVRSDVAAPPRRLAARERGQRAAHVGGSEHAALHRPEQVAALLQRLLGVDVEGGTGEAGVVGLAHRRREAADQVEVAAGTKPAALDQRLGRERRDADHIGGADRLLEIGARRGGDAALAQCSRQGLGLDGAARPDRHPLDRPHRAVGLGQEARDLAGADHQQVPGIGTGEPRGSERRSRGGAAGGDLVTVDQGERRAGARVVQQVAGMQPRQAAGGVAGSDVDDLDAVVAARDPGRHEQRGDSAADLVHVARRHDAACCEQRAQRRDQRLEGQGRARRRGIEDSQGHACSRAPVPYAPIRW